MIGAFLPGLAGRTQVHVGNPEGVVFNGIGPVGWRRRFPLHEVKDVQWRDNDGDCRRKTHIVIETREGRQIKVGSMLKAERGKFVASAVWKALPL